MATYLYSIISCKFNTNYTWLHEYILRLNCPQLNLHDLYFEKQTPPEDIVRLRFNEIMLEVFLS